MRLISVNDGTDTLYSDDFLLFRNIMNEWYAKDASKGTKFEKHMKRWQIPVFVTIINYYLSIEVVNKTLVMEIDGFS